jgi:hypothetical protein
MQIQKSTRLNFEKIIKIFFFSESTSQKAQKKFHQNWTMLWSPTTHLNISMF